MAMRGRHHSRPWRPEAAQPRSAAGRTPTPPVRCLVVHPLPVVRRGLASILSARGLHVVGEASTAAQTRAWLRRHRLDVVVVAPELPDGSGFDLTDTHDHRGRSPAWVVFAVTGGGGLVAEALRRGAAGLIVASSQPDEIGRVVGLAGRGELAYSPAQLELARAATEHRLTPRERDIVRELASARSNDEIAASFGLRPKTVETYLARLYRRFQVTSRIELLNRLRAEGLLEGVEPSPTDLRSLTPSPPSTPSS